MKIVDMNGDKINACFSFVVGNCEISISTIFNKNSPNIAIFANSGGLLKTDMGSIQSAVSWVNSYGPRD